MGDAMKRSRDQFITHYEQKLQDRTVTSYGNKPVTTFETNEFWQAVTATNNEIDDLFRKFNPPIRKA